MQMVRSFKHSLLVLLLAPLVSRAQVTDLLATGADSWEAADGDRWQFIDGEIHGSTSIFDGEKTDTAASTFLVARDIVEEDFIVSMEVTFERGRYLGVYLDFGQESRSGIWMATGHALAPDAPDNEVERGYIKTVENGFWVVRATGELVIRQGERIKLGFSRRGDAYSLWNDGKLIAVYRREGGYPPGPLQLRLTNSAVRIHSLAVRTGRGRQ
jgi:hypothetical protein